MQVATVCEQEGTPNAVRRVWKLGKLGIQYPPFRSLDTVSSLVLVPSYCFAFATSTLNTCVGPNRLERKTIHLPSGVNWQFGSSA